MSIDPTQLTTGMAIDKSEDSYVIGYQKEHKQHKTNPTSHNFSSSNPKTPFSACKESESVHFSDSSFAQSLLPFIHLVGITDKCIKQLSPSRWGCAWKNLAFNDKDIEDASYLLLDANTKLLRCGGLLHDKYIASASICELSVHDPIHDQSAKPHVQAHDDEFEHKQNGMQLDEQHVQAAHSAVGKMQWVSLPKLNHRRHGHRTLCIELASQQPHIISIGGFDSKGNTINKSEMLSVREIQSCIAKHSNNSNSNSNSKEKRHWSVSEHIARLPTGIADFGICHDSVTQRIYVCGGLDAQFRSLSSALCFDLQSNKWMNLPALNCARHCHRMQVLHSKQNPHTLLSFGGWSGISRNSVEVLDVRTNADKWQIHTNGNGNREKHGFHALSYPHSNCASMAKRFEDLALQHKLDELNMNDDSHGGNVLYDENAVIVCGHRQGLFVETNVMEALEMRTLKWETIATFQCAQNHNFDEALKNAQQTPIPTDNHSHIDLLTLRKSNRYSNGFRFLTLL